MKSNLLMIIFTGVSISLLGFLILILPTSAKQLVERNIEYFLTLPPISVASYILVFKYHEKFQEDLPSFMMLLKNILQGSMVAFFLFLSTAVISSLLFRLFIIFKFKMQD